MKGLTFVVVGVGTLGGWVLEFLARTPGPARIVAIDVDEDRGVRKVNTVACGAQAMGWHPDIAFERVDLSDEGRAAEVLRAIAPDVVIHTASLQAWWVVLGLPERLRERIADAGYGPWLPMHLTLTHQLMRALRAAALSPLVVTAPFPDAVNAVLATAGLAPTVGLGNMDELVPMIEREVARRLRMPVTDVRVWMIGHHFHNSALLDHGTTGGAPYFLRIMAGDQDVTGSWKHEELLLAATRMFPAGADDTPMIASSAIKNALALVAGTPRFTHAPGPLGLPGGYPVRLGRGQVELALPSGVGRDDAIRLNLEAQKYDGIEEIRADGTVVFTDKARAIMRETLGYDCRPLPLAESGERATELRAAYLAVAGRPGGTR